MAINKHHTKLLLEDLIRFSVSTADKCPRYVKNDEFEADDYFLSIPSGKPMCLILANDITNALSQKTAKSPKNTFRLQCSGCIGHLTLQAQPISNKQELLNTQQRQCFEVLAESLGRFAFFRTIDEVELKKVLPQITGKTFEPGSIIIKKGQWGQYLYIIESGTVEVRSGEHDEILLSTLGKGEIFGEMSLLSGDKCSATVCARERSYVLVIDKDLFKKMVERYPSLQNYLFGLLTNRLHGANTLTEKQISLGFNGNLSNIHIAEILQMLHMSKKDGIIRLVLPHGSALIAMKNGHLVHVAYGDISGDIAFYELLREQKGTFSFSPQIPSDYDDSSIIGDFMSLLMEGFMRIDESKREKQQVQ